MEKVEYLTAARLYLADIERLTVNSRAKINRLYNSLPVCDEAKLEKFTKLIIEAYNALDDAYYMGMREEWD